MDEGKSPLQSKAVHFNWISGVLVHAVWPMLPEHFRDKPYALSAVTSWFILGNITIRFFTDQALKRFWVKNENRTL